MKSAFALLFVCSTAFAAQRVEIAMKSLSFDPKVKQIAIGQTVVWKNTALTDHTATAVENAPAGPPLFDTGIVHPGKSSSEIKFDKAGSFPYQCSIHGKTMSGVINVQGPVSK
jgi:plastocyanin